ncbi:hypothetical protein GCM10009755_29700 [Brevibacterium samyangense]|uniref:Single-stranded DNA-binding protein n=2 Tax=Brevibacterium samyangense TaxID=366888 RepID=A0ABP5F5Q2_9MICO
MALWSAPGHPTRFIRYVFNDHEGPRVRQSHGGIMSYGENQYEENRQHESFEQGGSNESLGGRNEGQSFGNEAEGQVFGGGEESSFGGENPF